MAVPLLETLSPLLDEFTTSRFVALYPVSFRSVAINDGSLVSLKSDPHLHDRLSELLKSPDRICWLIFDRQARCCYIGDVGEAQTWLSRNASTSDNGSPAA